MKSRLFVTLLAVLPLLLVSTSLGPRGTSPGVAFAQEATTTSATTTTTGLISTTTPAPPPNTTIPLTTEVMTAGYVRYLQQTFPFLQVFYLETFKRCTNSFENYCFPALEIAWPRGRGGVTTPMQAAWYKQATNCLKTYCSCWPGGSLEQNFGSLQCRVPSLTQQQLCIAEEYCAAANSVCYMDWMYGIVNVSRGQLPSQCDSFLDCAARPSVVEDTFTACVADPPTKTLQGSSSCNASITCSYAKSQIDPNITQSGLIAKANSEEDGLTSGPRTSVANSIAYTVMVGIGLLVIFVVLMIGYAFIRYRNVNRMVEAQEAARSLTGDELRNETHVTAKWYGAPLIVKIEGNDETQSSTEDTRCVFSGKPNAKFMLLPCRSRWCGCETPKSKKYSTSQAEKEKKKKKKKEEAAEKEKESGEGKESSPDPATGEPKHVCCIPDLRPTVNPSGEPVEEIIDMSLYESSAISAVEKPGEGEGADRKEENASTSDGDSLCVICLDRKAIVAFFPCTHRAACGSCAKRIVEGDAVSRQTQVQNFAEGKKTASPCPLCRAEIEFAVVLEADPDAEEKEELDENGHNTKPLNSLTGQLRQNVLTRLKAFYKKYNPDGVKKIEDLFKYEWTEGEVMYKLMGKYCPTEQKKLKRRETKVDIPPPAANTSSQGGTSSNTDQQSLPENQSREVAEEGQQQRQVAAVGDDDAVNPITVLSVNAGEEGQHQVSSATGSSSSTTNGGSIVNSDMVEDADGNNEANAVEMMSSPKLGQEEEEENRAKEEGDGFPATEQLRGDQQKVESKVSEGDGQNDANLNALLDSDQENDDESAPPSPPPLPVQEPVNSPPAPFAAINHDEMSDDDDLPPPLPSISQQADQEDRASHNNPPQQQSTTREAVQDEQDEAIANIDL